VSAALSVLAPRHPKIKFVEIRATDAIHGYPERNCPTLLIYRNNDLLSQFVGLAPLGGALFTAEHLEWRLAELGVLQSTLKRAPAGLAPTRPIDIVFQ
jgi:hypothetical protein